MKEKRLKKGKKENRSEHVTSMSNTIAAFIQKNIAWGLYFLLILLTPLAIYSLGYVYVFLNPPETQFLYAAAKGHVTRIKAVVERYPTIDVNCRGTDANVTAMYVSCQNGEAEKVKYLIELGASIYIPSGSGVTSLMISSQNGHLECVNFLVDWHIGMLNKYDVSLGNDESMNEKRLKKSTKENYDENFLNHVDNSGRTALLLAIANNHSEIVRVLLENGSSPERIKRESGITTISPLFAAVETGNADIVSDLIGFGANIFEKRGDGVTPLMIASRQGQKDIVRLLIENGVTDERVESTLTATAIARIAGNEDIAEMIEETIGLA